MKLTELRDILKKTGLSQGEFAKELSVTGAAVSYWLKGQRQISAAMEKHIRRTAAELAEKAERSA